MVYLHPARIERIRLSFSLWNIGRAESCNTRLKQNSRQPPLPWFEHEVATMHNAATELENLIGSIGTAQPSDEEMELRRRSWLALRRATARASDAREGTGLASTLGERAGDDDTILQACAGHSAVMSPPIKGLISILRRKATAASARQRSGGGRSGACPSNC